MTLCAIWDHLQNFKNLKNIYEEIYVLCSPLNTGRKFNVQKTFTRCLGRLLNVLCTFNLRPLSRR